MLNRDKEYIKTHRKNVERNLRIVSTTGAPWQLTTHPQTNTKSLQEPSKTWAWWNPQNNIKSTSIMMIQWAWEVTICWRQQDERPS